MRSDGERLDLGFVRQEEVHLIGIVDLNHLSVNGRPAKPLVIPGHRGDDGMFWPNVSLQVSKESGKDWRTVESSVIKIPTFTLSVAADAGPISMKVVLDSFQRLTSEYKFGRIVLQTGEATVFPLSLLSEEGFKP